MKLLLVQFLLQHEWWVTASFLLLSFVLGGVRIARRRSSIIVCFWIGYRLCPSTFSLKCGKLWLLSWIRQCGIDFKSIERVAAVLLCRLDCRMVIDLRWLRCFLDLLLGRFCFFFHLALFFNELGHHLTVLGKHLLDLRKLLALFRCFGLRLDASLKWRRGRLVYGRWRYSSLKHLWHDISASWFVCRRFLCNCLFSCMVWLIFLVLDLLSWRRIRLWHLRHESLMIFFEILITLKLIYCKLAIWLKLVHHLFFILLPSAFLRGSCLWLCFLILRFHARSTRRFFREVYIVHLKLHWFICAYAFETRI